MKPLARRFPRLEATRAAAGSKRPAAILAAAFTAVLACELVHPARAEPAATSPCVYLAGDSLTEGYAPFFHLEGHWVAVGALGGQGSTAIAARLGARDTILVFRGPSEERGGAAHVASVMPDLLNNAGGRGEIAGTLAGRRGRLTWDRAGGYSIAFDDGNPPPAALSRFEVDVSSFARCALVLWAGRNGFASPGVALSDIAVSVLRWRRGNRPVLVLGITNGRDEGRGSAAYDQIATLNKDLARRYGADFFDVRRWLIDEAPRALGLADAVAGDRAADLVPAALRSDNIHLSPDANKALARKLAELLREKAW